MSNEDLILSELKNINKTMDEFKEVQEKHSVRTYRMERALLGDKEFQQKGVVDEVADAKKEIIKINEYIAKKEISEKESVAMKKGAIVGYSAAGAGGLYGIIEFFKSIFN